VTVARHGGLTFLLAGFAHDPENRFSIFGKDHAQILKRPLRVQATRGAVGLNSASGRNIGGVFAESIAEHWKTHADRADRETVIGVDIVSRKDLV
jgi:hypothetical protein